MDNIAAPPMAMTALNKSKRPPPLQRARARFVAVAVVILFAAIAYPVLFRNGSKLTKITVSVVKKSSPRWNVTQDFLLDDDWAGNDAADRNRTKNKQSAESTNQQDFRPVDPKRDKEEKIIQKQPEGSNDAPKSEISKHLEPKEDDKEENTVAKEEKTVPKEIVSKEPEKIVTKEPEKIVKQNQIKVDEVVSSKSQKNETKTELNTVPENQTNSTNETSKKIELYLDHQGAVNSQGQLEVPVGGNLLLWTKGSWGSKNLCLLLEDMKKAQQMMKVTEKPPLMHMTVACKFHTVGQGNWLSAYYLARMAAAVYAVDFQFTCTEDESARQNLILPWFQGYFPAPSDPKEYFAGRESPPSTEQTCVAKYEQIRLDFMAKQVQIDIRAMAYAIVSEDPKNSSKLPFIPNVEMDDVAIHFRCGDVMGGANRNDFGILGFQEYKKWIHPNTTRSIGIITQSFDRSVVRGEDRARIGTCRRVTDELVQFLQNEVVQNNTTKITLRNGSGETLPLAYARLVLAKQSFCSLSSFGIFPVMGTTGEGYIQAGNRGVNNFAKYLDDALPNLHVMRGNILTTMQIKNKINGPNGVENLVGWFLSNR